MKKQRSRKSQNIKFVKVYARAEDMTPEIKQQLVDGVMIAIGRPELVTHGLSLKEREALRPRKAVRNEEEQGRD